ncbi:22997_t:CDS:2, partial [Gigaspora margarita]
MSSSKHKDKTILTNKQRQDIIIYKSKYPGITNIELVDWVKKEFKLGIHLKRVKKHREDMSVDDAVVAAAISQLKELLKEYD